MNEQKPPARRRRTRRQRSEPLPDDLYDYAAEPKPSTRRSRRKPSPKWHDNLRVVDDWPDQVPVTEDEVDIFERYFGDLLDRLFGGPLYSKPGGNSLKNISIDDMDKE
ncbi:hypothetical protein [Shinella zoogloeoides]|uniref:Uncharacterized protein n=1 Tax=Shinella zoogloeoides TaxID=352475 RepID=A0A6N8TIE9_SHIZO|nr:hypothetical protein [Shinella zoogloeoides]MXO02195.1 hypothetical protein [Shinella zoogloeoides]UEX80366.1 hypothetical protein K8M09_12130 [Shinella zoogloeoides]